MAILLCADFRCLYASVEVPAAASTDFGLGVRPEALANWRDRLENWPIILPLLVSIDVLVLCLF